MPTTEPPIIGGMLPTKGTLRRAAAYVRMSTDHQRFSIENQMQAISEYALSRGVEIVRTYSDAACSGLTLHGRDALQRLIADVEGGRADFGLILVYDVSRWGRFQDADESAHFEFLCKKAGVTVEYCADGFQNDGSIMATLMKGLKRAMAAEFSRELSAKVMQGHSRLARIGFHQGGTAGFGLRRMLVDRSGCPKGMLQDGEEKNLQDDRVLLVPGPIDEVQTVREVFRMYIEEELSPRRIARILNEQGCRNGRGNPWTHHNVTGLLRSEKYVGNLLYNRTSLKLQTKRIFNPKHQWIRSEGVIAPIVEPEVFASAQRRLDGGWEIGNSDLLNHLIAVWCVTGHLSCKNMKNVPNTPVPNTYKEHFGSLNNAYRLIGYWRTHNYRYAMLGADLQRIDRNLIRELTSVVQQQGGTIRVDPEAQVLQIDGGTTVSTLLLPFRKLKRRHAGWLLSLYRATVRSQLMLVVRMNRSNTKVLDYHLLPFSLLAGRTFKFTDVNIPHLAQYRLKSLSDFYDACRKCRSLDVCL